MKNIIQIIKVHRGFGVVCFCFLDSKESKDSKKPTEYYIHVQSINKDSTTPQLVLKLTTVDPLDINKFFTNEYEDLPITFISFNEFLEYSMPSFFHRNLDDYFIVVRTLCSNRTQSSSNRTRTSRTQTSSSTIFKKPLK
jgi:hypothetical protein